MYFIEYTLQGALQ